MYGNKEKSVQGSLFTSPFLVLFLYSFSSSHVSFKHTVKEADLDPNVKVVDVWPADGFAVSCIGRWSLSPSQTPMWYSTAGLLSVPLNSSISEHPSDHCLLFLKC